MSKPDADALRISRLEAVVEKERLAAEKLKLEIASLQQDNQALPFYRDPTWLRPIIAGVSIALVAASYLHYIFIPEQGRLLQRVEATEFQLAKAKAEHQANVAQIRLTREQLRVSKCAPILT